MKKVLIVVLSLIAVLCCVGLFACSNIIDEPENTEGLIFVLDGNETSYSVTGYNGTSTEVYIRGTYKGLPVVGIRDKAFNGCGNLRSITIPDSVRYIGMDAFRDCIGLDSVRIGKGVTTIYHRAFLNCNSLSSISLPNSVTEIMYDAFNNCNSFTSIYYSGTASQWANIKGIGNLMRYGYSSKTLYLNNELPKDIVIEGTTTIEDYAFYKSWGLNSVTIGNSVENIGDYAFYGCWRIRNISVGNGVKNIGEQAFYTCYGLSSITIPNSVKSIGEGAFVNCTGLKEITIPDSVNSIGHGAFSYCYGLESVTIGNGVTSMGWGAFEYCSKLTSITIGNGILIIEKGVFKSCGNLTNVYYYGTAQGWSCVAIGSDNGCLTNATRYYYSETAPTTSGNFWHYVDGVPTKW